MSGPVVDIRGATVRFGETVALSIDTLTIERGERVFVLGRSGSGKTTLARLIKGRVEAAEGSVWVLGEATSARGRKSRRALQRRVAMIDQEFCLVPRMSVIGNVLCGSLGRVNTLKSLLGVFPTHEWKKAEVILDEVELEGLYERRVETLSGGQRQRVAIARALMQEAEVILADEPVSNLDPELAEDSLELLVNLATQHGVALVVNLHQPRLAKRFATRVVGLHEGRIILDGPPDELSTDSEELIYTGPESREEAGAKKGAANDHAATTLA